MSDEIFPELLGLKWESTKKPQWSTKLHETTSGKETAAAYWSYPKWFFTLAYEFLDESELVRDLQTLGGFFLARRGKFDSFLFRDPSDYKVEGQVLGIGDGARSAFQLIRSFGEFDEPIKNVEGVVANPPILVTGGTPTFPLSEYGPTLYVDGVESSTYSISSTGLVTILPIPPVGAVVSADFTFYFRCRFNQDEAEFTEFMAELWECKKLEMVTRK